MVEDVGAVRVMRLNRPSRRNALDLPLTLALHQALLAAEANASVRALVLGAEGPVFCAGGDFGEGERDGAEVLAKRL
jgi:enoyl-CoA hydratase/carnithine racemase